MPAFKIVLLCPVPKDVAEHAHKISTGGPPTILIGGEAVVTF